jgi:leader peptidase (prepilin peptidase)/N-methyltransferase
VGVEPTSKAAGADRTPWPRQRGVVPLAAALVILAFVAMPLDRAVVAGFTACTLVVLAAVDLERGIIPNRIVLPATAIVLLAQLALFPAQAVEWLLAAAAVSLALLIPRLIRPAWMGMGDVKLALLLGAALGWEVLGALLIACLSIFPVALIVLIRGGASARKSTLPFGPFLAFGALVALYVPYLAS